MLNSVNRQNSSYVTSPHLENPLNEFTSYSYHFIMSVTDTTTAIGKMIDQSNTRIPGAERNAYLSNILSCRRPGQKFDLGDGESAWLVLDTRRFSEYQIIAADTEHVYGSGDPSNPTMPASMMNFQLVDSTGMSFFSMLMDLFRNQIKSARLSCYFLISIVMVGHRPDGSTQDTIVSVIHIPAILLLMQFSVDHRGSVYDMVFAENDGGASAGTPMEVINSMGTVASITTSAVSEGSPLLGDLMQALEDSLNTKSIEFYKNYRNEALKQQPGVTINGKLVQYMITVPSEWRGFKCSQAAREENVEQMYTIEGVLRGDASEEERDAYLEKAQIEESGDSTVSMSFAPNTTITQAVTQILMSSKEVLDLASEKRRQEGNAILFKTVMTTTSDKNTYVIHVDVIPHLYPKADGLKVDKVDSSQPANSNIQPAAPTSVATGGDTPKNILVYDYIFTGKSSDILSMSIKFLPESTIAFDSGIDTGQNRASRVSATAGNSTTNMQESASPPERTSGTYVPIVKANEPILPGIRSVGQKANNVDVNNESSTVNSARDETKAKQEYVISQAELHFISSMSLSMVIRGNPNILRKHADRESKGGQPPHPTVLDSQQISSINSSTNSAQEIFNSTVRSPLAASKGIYYQQYVKPKIESATSPAATDGPDIMTSPLFFKINIKVPNIDYKTGEVSLTDSGEREPLYTDKFFFNGPYLSTSIKTHFEAGNFTHEVTLIPYILNPEDHPMAASGESAGGE